MFKVGDKVVYFHFGVEVESKIVRIGYYSGILFMANGHWRAPQFVSLKEQA